MTGIRSQAWVVLPNGMHLGAVSCPNRHEFWGADRDLPSGPWRPTFTFDLITCRTALSKNIQKICRQHFSVQAPNPDGGACCVRVQY
jgi:hypothetical protein